MQQAALSDSLQGRDHGNALSTETAQVVLNSAGPESDHACARCAAAAARAEADAKRIADLESQLQWLTVKASAAADKLADYEDQFRELAALPTIDLPTLTPNDAALTPPRRLSLDSRGTPPKPPALTPGQPQEKRSNISSRFQAFLNRRASLVPNPTTHPSSLPTTSMPSGTSSEDDPSTLLENERQARIAAENSLTIVQAELEELSAALFSQANEMVADERRMRAKDLERAQALEEQAALWQNQARRLEVKRRDAEEETKRWAVKVRDLQAKTRTIEPRTKEERERDERRWRRVEALERAVDRLGIARKIANGPLKAERAHPADSESTGDEQQAALSVDVDG